MSKRILLGLAATMLLAANVRADDDEKAGPNDNKPPEGFSLLFNGKDLEGWQGLIEIHKRAKDPEAYKKQVEEANQKGLPHWSAINGILVYDGKGQNLQTAKDYGDFEMMVDWKIHKNGDSGIYLRGQPQVQIWDPDSKPAGGIGSGGLYNNKKHERNPLKKADKPIGEWNHFHIIMKGDRVTVMLNGEKVVDDTPLENYFQPSQPLPANGPIELQNHGDKLWFKNIYIKELK